MNLKSIVCLISLLQASFITLRAADSDSPDRSALSPAHTAIKLHPLWRDHAVVQRDREIPVSGMAAPASEVRILWRGREFRTMTDAEGRWRTQVPSGPASAAPQVLRVECSSETLEVRDLLVGEVWLASGQSNMQWNLEECGPGPWAAPENLAPDPLLRLLTVPWNPVAMPQTEIRETRWRFYDRETALKSSAVAQFFGRELRRQLDIPIGIISSAVGGSPIEAWIPEEILRPMPQARVCFNQAEEYKARYPQLSKEDEEKRRTWEAEAAANKSAGRPPPPPVPWLGPKPEQDWRAPGFCWNGMINPLPPYAIRGVIWYQGEANVWRANDYPVLLETMVGIWRRAWGADDFPFLLVQLPGFDNEREGAQGSTWARFREIQDRAAHGLKNGGMVVALDLGEAENIHPSRKKEVGERLAWLAARRVYGKDVRDCGPVFERIQWAGDEAIVHFASESANLKTTDGKAPGAFSVAGEDLVFKPAAARIDGHKVILSTAGMPAPRFVRYAWANRPADANLTDSSGLPAAPFRTDTDPKPGAQPGRPESNHAP